MSTGPAAAGAVAARAAPVVEVRGLTKSFPGVRALFDVSVAFRSGEVHALVGENGAGKSTLIKILAGAYAPDAGEVLLDGEPVHLRSPHDAQARGLAFIHQEPNLVPAMSAYENMTLGLRRPKRLGAFIRWSAVRRSAQDMADRLRLDFDLATPVGHLGAAHQTMVAIGRALLLDARMVVLDEPTAALTDAEVHRLYEAVADLKAHGVAVVYISHRLDEIFSVADRVSVLKDGELVASRSVAEVSDKAELVRLIVGRALAERQPAADAVGRSDVVLRVRDLSWGTRVKGVSFDLHAGEVLGLTGLVGAGRSELARLLFGAEQPDAGTVELDGRPLRPRSPRHAIRAGVALLPEERRSQGAVTTMNVRENATLASLSRFTRGPLLSEGREKRHTRSMVEALGVRTRGTERPLAELSGGNQQKVIVGKWLATDARVLLFDEPTQGVDVGAKQDIYDLIDDLARRGKAVLVISSEIDEVVHLCPRVLVMREGELVADLAPPDEATILAHCYGTASAAEG